MKEIYTIGHSRNSIDTFLKLLYKYKINCIADIRSIPYSKFTPQYNKEILRKELKNSNIIYIFLGEELGARRDDKELYTSDGYLNFEKVRVDVLFQKGIDRLKTGLNKSLSIALMCTEKEPYDCHRSILVARELHEQGYTVNNILSDGTIMTQYDIENWLMDKYFPNRNQLTFDDYLNGIKTENYYIKQAYKIRNRDIGFSIIGTEEVE